MNTSIEVLRFLAAIDRSITLYGFSAPFFETKGVEIDHRLVERGSAIFWVRHGAMPLPLSVSWTREHKNADDLWMVQAILNGQMVSVASNDLPPVPGDLKLENYELAAFAAVHQVLLKIFPTPAPAASA